MSMDITKFPEKITVKSFHADIEYIRADIVQSIERQLRAKLEEVTKERDQLQRNINCMMETNKEASQRVITDHAEIMSLNEQLLQCKLLHGDKNA